MQGSCGGTVSLALLAAGDLLPVMFNMGANPFRMRHLPVVLCPLLGDIPVACGCVHQVVVGCVPLSLFDLQGPGG